MRTYTEQELIAFGNTMLSKPIDENRQSGVTDADVANFNEMLEKRDDIMELTEKAANALISLGGLFKGPPSNFKVKEGQVNAEESKLMVVHTTFGTEFTVTEEEANRLIKAKFLNFPQNQIMFEDTFFGEVFIDLTHLTAITPNI